MTKRRLGFNKSTECTLNALAFLFVSLFMVIFDLSLYSLRNILLDFGLFLHWNQWKQDSAWCKRKSLFCRKRPRSAFNVHFLNNRFDHFKKIMIGMHIYFHLRIAIKTFFVLFRFWDVVMELAISWPWIVDGMHQIPPIVKQNAISKESPRLVPL